MKIYTNKIVKFIVIGTIIILLIFTLIGKTNRRDLGIWSGLWWPKFDPQNPYEIQGSYPVQLRYPAKKRKPGSGWDSLALFQSKAHIEKGSIRIDSLGIHLFNEEDSLLTTYPSIGTEIEENKGFNIIHYHIGGPNIKWPHPCECSEKHQYTDYETGNLIIDDHKYPCDLTIDFRSNKWAIHIYPSSTHNFPEVELEIFKMNK